MCILEPITVMKALYDWISFFLNSFFEQTKHCWVFWKMIPLKVGFFLPVSSNLGHACLSLEEARKIFLHNTKLVDKNSNKRKIGTVIVDILHKCIVFTPFWCCTASKSPPEQPPDHRRTASWPPTCGSTIVALPSQCDQSPQNSKTSAVCMTEGGDGRASAPRLHPAQRNRRAKAAPALQSSSTLFHFELLVLAHFLRHFPSAWSQTPHQHHSEGTYSMSLSMRPGITNFTKFSKWLCPTMKI